MGKKKEKTQKANVKKPSFLTSNKAIQKTTFVIAGFLIGLFLLFTAFNLVYLGKILPHTYIGNLELGGKNKSQALNLLNQQEASLQKTKAQFNFEDNQWEIDSTAIALKFNHEKTVNKAFKIGRSGGFKILVAEQLKAIFAKNKFKAEISYDQQKLTEILTNISQKIDIPEKDASIEIKDLVPRVTAESTGKRLNLNKTTANILSLWQDFNKTQKDYLVIETAYPKITAAEAQKSLEEIEKILKGKIHIKVENKDFALASQDFQSWLEFKGELTQKQVLGESTQNSKTSMPKTIEAWVLKTLISQDKVKEYVANLAKEIDQEAKDAKFEVRGGKVSAFQLSQTGYKLNQEKAVQMIAEAILNGESQIVLEVETIEPSVGSSSAEEKGIKELVGEATTNFAGSPTNRRHNIAIGAKAIHGSIVKPGEEFSTLGHLSPVNGENGYLPELVIKEDGTKPEFGGGLCQVSTTLFRAAMNTGLKITERTNHSYRVSYYEPPVGMDATIYEPKPDFRFVNDMKTPILIQGLVSGDEITFQFYGTKDSRQVTISDPVVYAYTSPGDPIYVEDPGLAQGEIKQVERAHGGDQADFNYKVTLNDQTLSDENFHSFYTNWPALYLYGPGTQIPPAE